jgi:MFS family permease
MKIQEIARWVYLAFVLIAIMVGFVLGYSAYDSYFLSPDNPPANWAENIQLNQGYALFAMLLLGLVSGLTLITRKKIKAFLYATIGLIVASGVTIWTELWYLSPLLFFWARAIQSAIAAFAVPVAVLIALKLVLDLKKED